MSEVGKRIRMNEVFREDGRTLIVPMESLSPHKPWNEIARSVIRGEADAIMTTSGILKQYYNYVAGKIPIILTVPLQTFYIRLALKMGCSAVKWAYFGPIDNLPSEQVQKFSSECDKHGVPFYFELVPMTAPFSEGGLFITDAEVLMKTCLLAASLGADFIKTNFTDDPEKFQKITSACPVPVTILGGERISDEACLRRIKGAIDGGAAGGAFGRNVTTHANPEKIVRAVQKIIHNNASVQEAMKELT